MLTKNDEIRVRAIVKEEITIDTSPIKKDLLNIKKNLSKIQKDIKVIISLFDREYLQ